MKPTAFASVKFKRPEQVKDCKALLKYLQHRDGSIRREAFLSGEYKSWRDVPNDLRDDLMPAPDHRSTSWVDRGLGEDYKDIDQRLEDWQGRGVLMRHWVVSPDPDLMQHIPEAERLEVVARMTDNTVNDWYEANSWGKPEYAYVVHQATTTHPQTGQQLPRPHAHIITPGTTNMGWNGRPDHFVSRSHIRNLHQITQRNFEFEMARVLGPERSQQVIDERNARLEQERQQSKPTSRQQRGLRLGQQVLDAAQLLKTEEERRKAKREGRKLRRKRLTAVHIRAYGATHKNNQQRQQQEEWKIARQQRQQHRQAQQQANLNRNRLSQAERQEVMLRKGRRSPSHQERQAWQQRLADLEKQRQHTYRIKRLTRELEDPEFKRGFEALVKHKQRQRTEQER